jgi:hypothetical protein
MISVRKIPVLTVGSQVGYAADFPSWPQISTFFQLTIYNQRLFTQNTTYPNETWWLNEENQWKNVKKLTRIKKYQVAAF